MGQAGSTGVKATVPAKTGKTQPRQTADIAVAAKTVKPTARTKGAIQSSTSGKVSTSMSNGPGFSEKMIRSKQALLQRLDAGRYPMADASGPAGIARFTIVFAAGQIVGPVAVGWVSDGTGGLLRGFALSAALLAAGSVLALGQRALAVSR